MSNSASTNPSGNAAPGPGASVASSASGKQGHDNSQGGQGLLSTSKIEAAADAYPKPTDVKFTYGTAGFRTRGHILESTLFRIGLLAALRSKKLEGRTVGVMITASHNPEEDNGAKLVDPRGEMLESSWEAYATTLANSATTSDLVQNLQDLIATCKIDLSKPASVVYGRDTRPSGIKLVEALERGLEAIECEDKQNFGIVTTPCLHYVVRTTNAIKTAAEGKDVTDQPTEEGYYKKLAGAFNQLMSNRKNHSAAPLIVDCANGVGAVALRKLAPLIESHLPIRLLCTDTEDSKALNSQCGADFVKTNQKAPAAVLEQLSAGQRACSVDGDADRVIYYYLAPSNSGSEDTNRRRSLQGAPGSEDKRFRMLDGDKIATLAAGYIGDLVRQAGLSERIKIGVVQTAYANGSSTQYLKGQGLPVRCVPTGVKHLHHAAERYDIGVYFEANGHGTVLFSSETLHVLETYEPRTPAQDDATKYLRALTEVINQAVGDAISDFLLVEVILAHRRWGPEEWDQGYEDLPNRLVKVNVKDRNVFTTEDAERRLVTPAGLQERVDAVVRKFEKGRSFVRPSGTEDCVRVYAEASTRVGAQDLAHQVSQLVQEASEAM